MPNFEQMYFHLFSAVCDAIDAVNEMNFGTAKEILVKAAQNTEEEYMEGDESE